MERMNNPSGVQPSLKAIAEAGAVEDVPYWRRPLDPRVTLLAPVGCNLALAPTYSLANSITMLCRLRFDREPSPRYGSHCYCCGYLPGRNSGPPARSEEPRCS